ncbi:MAG: TatD family hydrolase [Halopseudomonas sp.]
MGLLQFCDTHCHLDFTEFDKVRSELLDSCKVQGVRAIVIPGVTAECWSRLLRLCDALSQPRELVVKPALGLHPCFMGQHNAEQLLLLDRLLEQNSVIAVGEIGLDFWDSYTDVEAQSQLFAAQLDLAKAHRLPVLLHARKSHDQVLHQLRGVRFDCGGIVHAFSGSLQQAERYVELGFKLGVGGAVTYSRALKLKRNLLQLGVEHWVLETDAPDMPLAGRQGELNRPDYLPEVFRELQRLYDLPAELLAAQLWRNAESVLGELVV